MRLMLGYTLVALVLLVGCGQDARGLFLLDVPGGYAAQGRVAITTYG
jgi:hypothetical protein